MICTNEDTKLINEIMRDFTNITKIAAIFVNNRGKVLSQEYNFSPFCKVVRRNPAYAKRCNQCDLYGGLDATKELSSCPYRCHMGLIDFSVPIMKDGAILGFISRTTKQKIQRSNLFPTQTDWRMTPTSALYRTYQF
ncbi:MAG: PocR ligand-binding domain-containing protein [Veillonella sp.]